MRGSEGRIHFLAFVGFQRLPAFCCPFLVPLESLVSVITAILHSNTSASLLEERCNYIGHIQIIQDNSPILRSSSQSHLQSTFLLCNVAYSQAPGTRTWLPLRGHYSDYHASFQILITMRPFQIPFIFKGLSWDSFTSVRSDICLCNYSLYTITVSCPRFLIIEHEVTSFSNCSEGDLSTETIVYTHLALLKHWLCT